MLLLAVIFFTLGFVAHILLLKYQNKNDLISDRIEVKPEEFDHSKMLKAFLNEEGIKLEETSDFMDSADEKWGSMENFEQLELGPKRKEDEKFVYYEFNALTEDGGDGKVKVEVKDGMIHLNIEHSKGHSQSSMEQVFSIDPSLDDKKAEVIHQQNKIIIKVPKIK